MTKPTLIDDEIIDSFDAMIVFSYAYEWQILKDKELDKLLKIKDMIDSHIEEEGRYYFNTQETKNRLVANILNGLQGAVNNNKCPEPIPLKDVWLNMPLILTSEDLNSMHREEFNSLFNLARDFITCINNSLADELKPFITNKQVDALFNKFWTNISNDFPLPILKDELVILLHQYYLKRYSINQESSEETDYYRKLIEHYCKKAELQFFKMVRQYFIDTTVNAFFTQAKGINLIIDKYYSWAALCYCPMNYKDLLVQYAYVNALGLVKDGRYRGVVKPIDSKNIDWGKPVSQKLAEIIKCRYNYQPFPPIYKDNNMRYMFDSNDIDVLIDGKPLHNHLVLALSYDQPISDLNDRVNDFARYLGNQAHNYRQTFGSIFGSESKVNSVTKYRNLHVPYNRISLKDKGSVLLHICTLLCLQYKRSPKYADDQKKRVTIDIYTLINYYGFLYSNGGVKNVNNEKKIKINIENVMQSLSKSHIAYERLPNLTLVRD